MYFSVWPGVRVFCFNFQNDQWCCHILSYCNIVNGLCELRYVVVFVQNRNLDECG